MKLYRTMLYVPGHRADWVAKAPRYGADALLLELEDGVPVADQEKARGIIREGIGDLTKRGVATFVRINGIDTHMASDDLEAVVVPGLIGVMVPKIENAGEVLKVAAWLEHFERKAGMEVGSVKILPLPETAPGIMNAYQIASASDRVASVMNGVGSRAGDIVKAIGYKWTPAGDEALYMMSHILLANRAAGIKYPLSGGSLDVKDLDQVRKFMIRVRNLGYRGMMLIHPSVVPIANELFAPSAEEIEWNKGVLRAIDEGEKAGRSAVVYDGGMIDYAHVRSALELLKQAKAFGIEVGDYPEVFAP